MNANVLGCHYPIAVLLELQLAHNELRTIARNATKSVPECQQNGNWGNNRSILDLYTPLSCTDSLTEMELSSLD